MLLREASERLSLSARGFHRMLKLARTIADLDGAHTVSRSHLVEALSYRIDAINAAITRSLAWCPAALPRSLQRNAPRTKARHK